MATRREVFKMGSTIEGDVHTSMHGIEWIDISDERDFDGTSGNGAFSTRKVTFRDTEGKALLEVEVYSEGENRISILDRKEYQEEIDREAFEFSQEDRYSIVDNPGDRDGHKLDLDDVEPDCSVNFNGE